MECPRLPDILRVSGCFGSKEVKLEKEFTLKKKLENQEKNNVLGIVADLLNFNFANDILNIRALIA